MNEKNTYGKWVVAAQAERSFVSFSLFRLCRGESGRSIELWSVELAATDRETVARGSLTAGHRASIATLVREHAAGQSIQSNLDCPTRLLFADVQSLCRPTHQAKSILSISLRILSFTLNVPTNGSPRFWTFAANTFRLCQPPIQMWGVRRNTRWYEGIVYVILEPSIAVTTPRSDSIVSRYQCHLQISVSSSEWSTTLRSAMHRYSFAERCHTDAGETMWTLLHVRKWRWHSCSAWTSAIAHPECQRKLYSCKLAVCCLFVSHRLNITIGSLVVEKVRHSVEHCSFGCSSWHRSSTTDLLRRSRRTYQEYRCRVRSLGVENEPTSSVRIDCGPRRSYRSKQPMWKISSKMLFIEKSRCVKQRHKRYQNSWKQRIPPWFHLFSPICSTSTTRTTRCDDCDSDVLIVQLYFSSFLLRSISSDGNSKPSPWTRGSHVLE